MLKRTVTLWVAAAVASPSMIAFADSPPALRIISPAADTVVSGPTRIEVALEPASDVQAINVFANGRLLCTLERQPFRCAWDPGPTVRAHHVRVVATLRDGSRLVQNVRTRDLGYTERVRTEAVLVPVIVTRGGQFVRGLKARDFQVLEDGVPQSLASFIDEESALDLVLAIDISGSMEDALDQVKPAVKHLLSRLRAGDAATLLGFNDTTFLVAEREIDPRARESAVDLLSSFGGTALYDATLRTLDLVSREWGRKGVVIFSDGDDRSSLTSRETVLNRVYASDAMLYTIGFGAGATSPELKQSLQLYAQSTGGRAFFPRSMNDLDEAFDQIVGELAHQYVLSYSSTNMRQDGKWRTITVKVRNGHYDVRARRGYRATTPQQAQR